MLISNFIGLLRRQIAIFCRLLGWLSSVRSLRIAGMLLGVIRYRFSSCFYGRIRNALLLASHKTITLLSPKNEHITISKLSYFQVTLPKASPKDH